MVGNIRSIVACLASVTLSGAIAQESIKLALITDSEMLTRYRGAAFEDVFGFGFWPTWSIALLTQALFVGLVVRWATPGHRRRIAYLLIFIFALASAVDFYSYKRAVNVFWDRPG